MTPNRLLTPTPLRFTGPTGKTFAVAHTDRAAALGDLKTAWQHPEVRAKIQASVMHGTFRHCPRTAHTFLNSLDRACQNPAMTDPQRYDALQQSFSQLQQGYQARQAQNNPEIQERVERRTAQVRELMKGIQPDILVDIGTGDGQVAASLANAFERPPNILGLDVFVPDHRPPNMARICYDGVNLPLRSNSTDLMSLFAVLHHVEAPLTLLRDIRETLKPGGHLLIREFDAHNEPLKRFNVVMDDLWCRVYDPNPDVPCPGNFQSMTDWVDLFKQAGFVVERRMDNPEPDNPYQPFMLLLKKPETI